MPFTAGQPLELLTEADLADLDDDALLYVVLDPGATALSRAVALATLVAHVGADYVPLTQRGTANGVATLDGGGLIPGAQLPPLALGETFTVASQAAMLALVAQRGDMAIRTDLDPDGFFLLTSDSPGTLADWKQILAPGSVVSVDGRTGAVTLGDLYAPIANPTFTGNVVVPDADAATEALNRQTGDARYAPLAAIPLAYRLSPLSDTYIDSQNATTNNDGGAALVIGSSWASTSFARRALLTFDTSALAGLTVRECKLRLVCSANGGSGLATLSARRVLRAYSPTQVTWNVYSTGNNWTTAGAKSTGSDISLALYGSTAVNGAVDGDVWLDLTDLLKASLAAGETTLRIILGTDATSSDNSVSFHSVNSATAAYRPTLDVVTGPLS